MVRQSNVGAAYSPLNHKKKHGGNTARLCASLAVIVFVIVFLSLGGNNKADSDNLRSGQAHHVGDYTTPKYPASPEITSTNAYNYNDQNTGDENAVDKIDHLQETVDVAELEIRQAEMKEVDKKEALLKQETGLLTNLLRATMGSVFGPSLSSEEVNDVATTVQQQLDEEASMKLRTQADQLTNQEITDLKYSTEAEVEAGVTVGDIEEDLYDQEKDTIRTVRSRVDSEAKQVKESLSKRAAEIEKEILEERLSAKLGKRVKLVIVEDKVQVGEIDGMMADLKHLMPDSSIGNGYGPAYPTPYGSSPSQQQLNTQYGVPAPKQSGSTMSPSDEEETLIKTPEQTQNGELGDNQDDEDEDSTTEESDGVKDKDKGGWW